MASTISELLTHATRVGPERPAYRFRDEDGQWQHVNWRQASERTERLGNGLISLGLQTGDRICLLGNSRLEWVLSDFAALGAGLVVVPIYQTNSPEECEHILRDSEARAVIVEDAEQLNKVQAVRAGLPQLEHVILMEGSPSGDGVTCLKDVEAAGEEDRGWRGRRDAVKPGDMATFIYTSGTTGPPKGCMLTHGNYADMTEMVYEYWQDIITDHERAVLFLPLAHTFARLISFLSARITMEIVFTNITALMDDIAETEPTILPSVPRVFEKAYNRINGQFEDATGVKRKLIDWAMAKGRLRGRYVEAGRKVPPVLAAQYALAHKLVFSKIHARFGGELRFFVTGGAPLSREIHQFFLAAGVTILEGYGLTECTTACTLTRPDAFRVGSVGRALPRTDLKTGPDGEILIKGPQIFQGYHNNPEATAEALSDGWLHTGDIGEIDRDGFLRITDRKKDIIVTAGGKNISPQNIEGGLKATQYVSQAMVIGDRRPYLTALVTMDPLELEGFAKEHGLPTDMHELIDTPQVQKLVREAVDHVNADLGRVEQIKRFRILPVDFTQETGELTPTLKLKRKLVHERYERYIEEMYAPDAPDCAAITDPSVAQLQKTPVEA